jgi:proteasome lid subunit RPN8/RPN11
MRWTDVEGAPTHRTLAAWRDAMFDRVAPAPLDDIVARERRRADGDAPLIVLAAGAMRSAQDHVAASPLERGGLLLGEPLVRRAGDADPVAVFVRAAVPGLDDHATGYSLRLNAGVWDAARAGLAPGEVVVGWFHSHPGIGAFFSDTDRRTQAGFFRHPFSVGWVIDPVRGEQAWFVGPRAHALPPAAVVPLG